MADASPQTDSTNLKAECQSMTTLLSKLNSYDICKPTLLSVSSGAGCEIPAEVQCKRDALFKESLSQLQSIMHACNDEVVPCTSVFVMKDGSTYDKFKKSICECISVLLFSAQQCMLFPGDSMPDSEKSCRVLLHATMRQMALELVLASSSFVSKCCIAAKSMGVTGVHNYLSQLQNCVNDTIKKVSGEESIDVNPKPEDVLRYFFPRSTIAANS